MNTELVRMRRSVRLAALGFAGVLALILVAFTWGSLANSAALSASPAAPRQNDTVTLVGSGFLPFETVSVWITYPDFRVYGVAEVATDAAGAFSFPYLPDFLGATFTPTGKYTYTAHGQLSGREVYADINVAIGQAPGASAGVTLSAAPARMRRAATSASRAAATLPARKSPSGCATPITASPIWVAPKRRATGRSTTSSM